jgi:hypothetical protein
MALIVVRSTIVVVHCHTRIYGVASIDGGANIFYGAVVEPVHVSGATATATATEVLRETTVRTVPSPCGKLSALRDDSPAVGEEEDHAI